MERTQIKLFIATSLDGFIARKDGQVDWLFTDADYGYSEFYETVDALVMGRKTYDQVLSFGDWPYSGKACYIFTHQKLHRVPAGVESVSGEVTQVIQKISGRVKKGIWLVGGADLVAAFRLSQCIDAYILSIHPILLGEGIPLFSDVPFEETYCLVDTMTYPSGLAQLHYVRQIQD